MGEHCESMTLDGAIEHLDELLAGDLGGKCAAEHERLRGWLAELRERRSAGGCKYCESEVPLGSSGDVSSGVEAYISDGDLVVAGWFDGFVGIEPIHVPIDYCPMCRRPLKEARDD